MNTTVASNIVKTDLDWMTGNRRETKVQNGDGTGSLLTLQRPVFASVNLGILHDTISREWLRNGKVFLAAPTLLPSVSRNNDFPDVSRNAYESLRANWPSKLYHLPSM